MKQYPHKNIIELAQSRGSAAKTKSGAWKYLREHAPKMHYGLSALGTGRLSGSTRSDHNLYLTNRMYRAADGRAEILGYDLKDYNTPGRILDRAYADNNTWDDRRSYDIRRDNYGALSPRHIAARQWTGSGYIFHRPRPETAYYDALDLVSDASAAKLIPRAYDSIGFDRRGRAEGDALHHDLYDFNPNAAIVCIRRAEGTRYGVKTLNKSYILIERIRGEIAASDIALPVAKFAKLPDIQFGQIIARVRGEADAVKLPTPLTSWDTAYKALALDGDKLRSIYSGEEYAISGLKRERAQDDHSGGYYVYPTIEQASTCEVPDNSKCIDLPRVIARCEVAGREIHYGSGKIARTYLRPVEIVASVL